MARRIGDLRADDATWSPERSEIDYVSHGDLFRINRDGTNIKLLAHLPGKGWRPPFVADPRFVVAEAKHDEEQTLKMTLTYAGIDPSRLFGVWALDYVTRPWAA